MKLPSMKRDNTKMPSISDCSTAAEEQDLWSEFNLLKDVSHPNVIRLLGVCTGEGKFEFLP